MVRAPGPCQTLGAAPSAKDWPSRDLPATPKPSGEFGSSNQTNGQTHNQSLEPADQGAKSPFRQTADVPRSFKETVVVLAALTAGLIAATVSLLNALPGGVL